MKRLFQGFQDTMYGKLVCTTSAAFIVGAFTATDVLADVTGCVSQSPPAQGSENVMVTFDDIYEQIIPPGGQFDYRGVTYEVVPTDTPAFMHTSLVFGNSNYCEDDGQGNPVNCDFPFPMPTGIPIVRHVTSPLLATICAPNSDPACDALTLRLTFDEPTPFVGFGYGFNDYLQQQNGKSTLDIGWVTLYNSNGRVIKRSKLRASRLYCCTEGRFDYMGTGKGAHQKKHVAMAEIEFSYDYQPFNPGQGDPGAMKFFGIDNVSYSIPPYASLNCPPQP